jgi:hypothetical protein
MKKVKFFLASALTLFAVHANAALLNFTGNIANHNDVIYTYFTLTSDATNIRVWTDSFLSGTNFDPITALWNADSGDLLSQNDDNDNVNPATQTFFDSGFSLASLSAGNYAFTVATYANFASGVNLANPQFNYSNAAPIPLAEWCQPASHCGMGTFWSVWMDGVDSGSTTPPGDVPEPSITWLMSLGLALCALRKRRFVA